MKKLIRKILKEDLEYWRVSDASPNSDEYKMGITEDIPIYKEHNLGKKMYERLRKAFPMTPEYVLKDFFYNNVVNEFETIEKEYYGDPLLLTRGYWGEYLRGPWKLEILNVNPEDVTPKISYTWCCSSSSHTGNTATERCNNTSKTFSSYSACAKHNKAHKQSYPGHDCGCR